MLNYINKCVYLPKMAPLKQGSLDVLGIRGVWGGVCCKGRMIREWVVWPMNGGSKAELFELEG